MDIDIDVAIKNTLRHVRAHEMKQKSKSELAYSSALSESIADMNNIRRHANLDKILIYEQALMHHDLERYTENAQVQKNVLLGIDDLIAGISDYKILRDDPRRYFEKQYVKREMAPPDREVPLDSMRKALRSHASRIASYAASPMVNDIEREFQKARLSLIRRAERLYDAFQRSQKESLNP